MPKKCREANHCIALVATRKIREMETRAMSRIMEYDYYVALITVTATEEEGLRHIYKDWKPMFLEGDDQKYYEAAFERGGKTLHEIGIYDRDTDNIRIDFHISKNRRNSGTYLTDKSGMGQTQHHTVKSIVEQETVAQFQAVPENIV